MDIEIYKKQFEELLNCETLGFFNCCEKITVFIYNKEKDETYNFFTILSFDECIEPQVGSKYLTDELIFIKKDISLGIIKTIETLEEAKQDFEKLCVSSKEDYIDIGQGKLEKGFCEILPKSFVQKDSTKKIIINKVLKNNFYNGSYFFEFFDVDKKVLTFFNSKQIKKITDKIYEVIPIDLFTVSDRIGNFIVQVPSLNVKMKYTTDEKEENLMYKISVDNRLKEKINFQLISESFHDDTVVGYGAKRCCKTENLVEFNFGDTSNMINSTLIDLDNNIILSRQETSFIRSFNFTMSVGTQYGEQRTILDKENKLVDIIDVVSKQNIDLKEPITHAYKNIIKRRQHKRRVEELIQRHEFRQYGKTPYVKKATQDIIELMNKCSTGKVYIWDPYLCVDDLINTWYYTKTYGLKLQAITSSEVAEKSHVDLSEWIKSQQKEIESRSNNYGINIEIRCQGCGHGYKFHDRFIMMINDDGKSKVWSLGTSINSLGKKHHIVQEVQHPQMVIDAFEELWELLSSKECLIWKRG